MAQSPLAYKPTLTKPIIDRGPWAVLIVLSMGFFMILLDTTIVNVAIPSIITSLHASLDQVLWILNAYILVYAVLLITAGRLGDMIGPKKLFILGLVIFTASSAACGQAHDSTQLIIFRVVQGIGGAILTPQSLSIITSIFPPEKRGAAFGVWGAVAGLAAAAGPTLGGYLTTAFSWAAIFYVNVPIGVAVIVLAYLVMPEMESHRKHHLDVVGVLLSTAGLFAGVFGLIEGENYSWGRIGTFASFTVGSVHASLVSIPTILLAAILLLTMFVLWEARQDEPLLPLSLFGDRNFSVANIVSAIVAFGMLGLFLPLTLFLQSVLGLTAEQSGIALVPTSLVSMVVAPVAGRLTDRINGKYVLATGLTLYAIGMGLVIYVASLHATGTTFTLPLIVAGVGMGCTFAPMTALAMRDIAPYQAGAASGFINTVRQVGGALGSAVVGAVLQNRLGTQLHSQAVQFSHQLPAQTRSGFVNGFSHAASGGFQVGRGQTGDATHQTGGIPPAVAQQIHSLGQQVFQHAFLNAMKPSLALPIVVLVFGAFVTQLMRAGRQASSAAAPAVDGHTSGLAAAGE